jgi:hypothetical protein
MISRSNGFVLAYEVSLTHIVNIACVQCPNHRSLARMPSCPWMQLLRSWLSTSDSSSHLTRESPAIDPVDHFAKV